MVILVSQFGNKTSFLDEVSRQPSSYLEALLQTPSTMKLLAISL